MQIVFKPFFQTYIISILFSLSSCQDGLNELFDGKIVGGTDTDISQHPFQVSIQFAENGRHLCGGAIITNTVILTAAHCTDAYVI